MIRFILKRVLMIIPVILGVSLVIFTMQYFTPGDAAEILLRDTATEEQLEEYREQLGLNDPFLTRYSRYMKDALHGDLGISFSTKTSVTEELLTRFPVTLSLASLGVLVAVAIGVSLGILSAVKQYSAWDTMATLLSLFGISIPNFWFALMLILIFSVNLGWFPPSGLSSPLSYVLPICSIGLNSAGTIMRMTRSSMLEVLRQDYIRTARAKGQKELLVICLHALPNALIPIITIIGLQFGRMMGGTVISESIFSIAGIGKLMVDAVKARNFPVVMGGVMFIALLMSVVNLIVDIIYAFVDPRVRSQYVKRKVSVSTASTEKEGVANA